MPYSIENGRIFGILIDNSYTVGSVPVCNLKKLGLLIIAPAMCLEVLEIRNTTGTVPVTQQGRFPCALTSIAPFL